MKVRPIQVPSYPELLGQRLRIAPSRRSGPAPATPADRRPVADLARALVSLRDALAGLRLGARARATPRSLPDLGLVAPQAASASPLGLEVGEPSPTVLESSEEVNTVPTSISRFGPEFTGSSTTQPLVGGVYDGTQGDDTLTFQVKKGGQVGVEETQVDVLDGAGNRIGTLRYLPSDLPGTVKTAANGLELSFGVGLLVLGDAFTVDVYATVGSAVDPTKPFDGTHDDDPNFEDGLGVTAGSIEINGTAIQIASDDTLNGVLERITASDAGVTATFDAERERVVLEQKTPGPDHDVVLGEDTSGFFAATKLADAVAVPGGADDLDRPIAEVTELAGLQAGAFSVGGVRFRVDPSVDSLRDVLDRITASSTGVTARYDETRDRVVLEPDARGTVFELDDGTSGFFSALDVALGTYGLQADPRSARRFESPRAVRARLDELPRELERLFAGEFSGLAKPYAEEARTRLRDAVASALESVSDDPGADRVDTGLGLLFDWNEPRGSVLRIDRAALRRTLSVEPAALADLLLGERGAGKPAGLLELLDQALETSARKLLPALDPADAMGLVIDLRG